MKRFPSALFCFGIIGVVTLWFASAPLGHAAVLIDDFAYPANTALSGQGGWTGSNNINVIAGNLTLSGVAGYQVVQGGTGLITSTGSGSVLNFQTFTEVTTGELWFSTLVMSPDNVGTDGRVGIYLDVIGGVARDHAALGVILVGNQARRVRNGVMETSGPVFAMDQTHLVLGRVDVASGAVSLWIDPTNVTSVAMLGTETFSFLANIGGGISNLAVETYSGGRLDALRMGSSLNAVTGRPEPIPEPTSVVLLLGVGLVALSRWRRLGGYRNV